MLGSVKITINMEVVAPLTVHEFTKLEVAIHEEIHDQSSLNLLIQQVSKKTVINSFGDM